MKNRPERKESNDSERVKGESSSISKKRKRWKKQPFSLKSLINSNASSNGTDYNPYLIKKKREFYNNAKWVKKYKKSLLNQSESHHNPPATAKFSEDGDCSEIANDRKIKNKKNGNSLKSLQQEYEKRREEEENARVEREAIIQAKKQERERAEARRRELKGKMFKRTRHGQPIMKYRIEHLLEGIKQ